MDNITNEQDDKPPASNKIKLQLKKRPESASGNSQNGVNKEPAIKLSVNSDLGSKESVDLSKKLESELSNEANTEKKVTDTVKLNLNSISSKTGLNPTDLNTNDFSKDNLNNSTAVTENINNAESFSTKPKIKLSNQKPEVDAQNGKINLNLKSNNEIEDLQVKDDGIPPVQLEAKNEKVSLRFSDKPDGPAKKKITDTIKLKMSPDSKLPSFSEAFDSMEKSNDILKEEPSNVQQEQNIQTNDEPVPNLNVKSKRKITTIYIIIALIILLVLIYYVCTSLNVFLSLG
ncbi:MAG TPA: hypothetical protein QF753_21790 [Victivallales bacterium]|nr:hypothetical protein [Victivallales bacterium]